MNPHLEELLAPLNDAQRGAVLHGDGPACVASAAGSGKTSVVVARIAYLVLECGVSPSSILAMTFSRSGAGEMNDRLKRLGIHQARVGTIHSVSLEILRTETGHDRFNVDERKLLTYALKDILAERTKALRAAAYGSGQRFDPEFDAIPIDVAEGYMSHAKAFGIPMTEDVAQEFEVAAMRLAEEYLKPRQHPLKWAPDLVEIYRQHELARVRRGLLSFDDMAIGAWLILDRQPLSRASWQDRFKHVIIDEAQDSTPIQWRLARILSEHTGNLMAVGDGAQSLYSFRSARLQEFTDFATHPNTQMYRLPKNYRSGKAILRAASKLIQGFEWNFCGELVGNYEGEGIIEARGYESSDEEANALVSEIQELHSEGTPWHEIAVLCRAAAGLNAIEERLLKAQVPYVALSGVGFYERKEVKDLLAYLEIAALRDPRGDAVKRVLNVPTRYLGKAFLSAAEAHAREKNIALLDAIAAVDPPKPYQKQRAKEFVDVVVGLNELITEEASASRVLASLLDRTKYIEWLQQDEGDDIADPDQDRIDNVQELLRVSQKFPSAMAFLDFVAEMRRAITRGRRDGARHGDAVVLSSVHRVKGLEYDTVYSLGWNHGRLPIVRGDSLEDEERRIAYVAVTRAKRRFVATYLKSVDPPPGWDGDPTKWHAGARTPSQFLVDAGLFGEDDYQKAVARASRFKPLFQKALRRMRG